MSATTLGSMEISPLSMAQIHHGRDGRRYEVSGDAAAIVAEIHRLDDTLGVVFNEGGGYFTVFQRLNEHRVPDPQGELQETVLRVAFDEWDRRVVQYVELRAWEMRNGKDPNERLDAEADARKRDRQREFDDAIGAHAQKMFHSAQRDLGIKPRIFIPRGVAA